jgi:hypothetical protein
MNIKVVDYSEKAVAIMGAVTVTEKSLVEMRGMFCPNLRRDEGSAPGWVFSRKQADKVIERAKLIGASYDFYSEKSIVLWYCENHAKELIKARGMYNAHLRTEDGGTAPGWIFSKAHQDKVIELAKALSA